MERKKNKGSTFLLQCKYNERKEIEERKKRIFVILFYSFIFLVEYQYNFEKKMVVVKA
jgi:hypothetical protein